MEEYQEVFMRIREWFRKNQQTSWGKNQIIQKLDEMEEHIKKEKENDGSKNRS